MSRHFRKIEYFTIFIIMDSDLRYIRSEIEHVKAEALESTRRIVIYAHESSAIADKTLEVLDEQSEQLRRIQSANDKIEQINKVVNRDISIINRCCCCCCYNPSINTTSTNKPSIITTEPTSVRNISARQVIRNVHNDEISENLEITSEILKSLKQKAIDIGTELDEQNDTLDAISSKTIINTKNINSNTKNIT
jgi:hypothetical protein